ncbi:sensor histidine kinase [Rhodococcus sp. NPDC003994]
MATRHGSVTARSAGLATATASAGVLALVLVTFVADDETFVPDGARGPAVWAATIAVVLVQSALLVRERRSPVALVAASALPIVLAVAAPSALYSITALPVLVHSFRAGVRVGFVRLRWWLVVAAAAVAVGQFVNTLDTGRTDHAAVVVEAVVQAIVVVGAPLLPASVVDAQRATRDAQQQVLVAATRERDARIGEAVARERAAMARELHDIAAHHLSGISLLASAVAKQVDTDPDAARRHALLIRAQSTSVLEDLRRLVGLLRSPGAVDGAIETVATVPALVDAARSAGHDVTLDVHRRSTASPAVGDGIGPLGQLAAYRMVQESLTNAARYAEGASVTVVVDDTDDTRLHVRVRNTPPPVRPNVPGGSGFGTIGMRERAVLTGGSFDAGPTDDGGWETRMSIPREPNRPEER